MSVLKCDRQESPVQFIDTAMKLLEHTIKYTRKQFNNKDYDLVRRIRDLSIDILNNVVMANAIFPKSQNDIDRRYEHFRTAKSCCFALMTLISTIKNVVHSTVTSYGWLMWGTYLKEEINLINKVIASDKKLTF